MAAVTIQATGRQWKVLLLVGFLTFFVGAVIAGLATNESFARSFGLVLVTFSLIMVVISRIGGWWQNE
jgi:uncharacterized membrane protein YoaK (UPF0700 family)